MKIPSLIPVNSSMLQAVGYDSVNNALFVQFNGGKIYRYDDVPEAEFANLRASESIGKYLNGVIKPNYTATLVQG